MATRRHPPRIDCLQNAATGLDSEYEISGKVVSFDRSKHKVTISHGDIPGYMEGMSMPFTIKDDWVYDALTTGADIKGTLVVENGLTWIENAQVTSPAVDGAPPNVGEHPGNDPVAGTASRTLLSSTGWRKDQYQSIPWANSSADVHLHALSSS
jgi:Cu/Ag efflux protein CusF